MRSTDPENLLYPGTKVVVEFTGLTILILISMTNSPSQISMIRMPGTDAYPMLQLQMPRPLPAHVSDLEEQYTELVVDIFNTMPLLLLTKHLIVLCVKPSFKMMQETERRWNECKLESSE
jgi:hypothetical protein